MTKNSQWFTSYKKNNFAHKIKIFCFPYAGGRASIFKDWINYTNPNTEIIGIELPGRGNRFHESLTSNLNLIVTELENNLSLDEDIPFIFFGYSLGSKIAFELCRRLFKNNKNLPKHLIIASAKAPHILHQGIKIHKLNNFEFISEIKKYQGLPKDFFNNEELIKLFLPILRADFKISEDYQYKINLPFSFPITVISGNKDPKISKQCPLKWKKHTIAKFNYYILDSGHFIDKNKKLFKIINKIIGPFT